MVTGETATASKPFTYENIPAQLQSLSNWILWKRVWREEKQKWDKVPLQLDGRPASVTNRAHYAAFDTALLAYGLGAGDGLGFCFTSDTGLVFIDLDGDKPDHRNIIAAFPTWGEVSQSGAGAHLICQGALDRARVHHVAGVEVYSAGRFCAMTGWSLPGHPDAIAPLQPALDGLVSWVDTLKGTWAVPAAEVTPRPPILEDVPSLDNIALGPDIRAFLLSGVAERWDNDRSRAMLAAATALYGRGLDDSAVLTTLWTYCGHIATQHRPVGDALEWLWRYSVSPARHAMPPTIEQMFNAKPTASADVLATLLARTAQIDPQHLGDTDALNRAKAVLMEAQNLDPGSQIAVHNAVMQAMRWKKQEVQWVARCLLQDRIKLEQSQSVRIKSVLSEYVFIANINQFIHKPTSQLLKIEAFVALYQHIPGIDKDAALASDGCDKVMSLDFDPAQPAVFSRDGGTYLNTWKGLEDHGVPGDPAPWLGHLAMLIPERQEQEHLLNWMSFTLQHPHIKINHCVILGGAFGIGKDTLFHPLTTALGCHAKAIGPQDLESDFNDFLVDAKLLIVQEADMGNRRDAARIANRMKPMLANPPETLLVNPKGVKAFRIKNIVHAVLLTNEAQPALLKHGDRRYYVLMSDQRIVDDRGTPAPEWEGYFERLWRYLNGGGTRTVIDYLLKRDLRHFNPKAPPPVTIAKRELVDISGSPIEDLVKNMKNGNFGPFAKERFTAEELHRWITLDGAELMRVHGVRGVPNVKTLSRALSSNNVPYKREYVYGTQVRLWFGRCGETPLTA